MFGAELIDLVMDFVSDPEFVIFLGIVEHCLIDHIFF
jgi:hypothetical protein